MLEIAEINWRIIILGVGCVVLLLCSILMVRNHLLLKFTLKLLKEEANFTRKRIEEGKGYDGFRRDKSLPSWETMLFSIFTPLRKYYKPLSDFYKD